MSRLPTAHRGQVLLERGQRQVARGLPEVLRVRRGVGEPAVLFREGRPHLLQRGLFAVSPSFLRIFHPTNSRNKRWRDDCFQDDDATLNVDSRQENFRVSRYLQLNSLHIFKKCCKQIHGKLGHNRFKDERCGFVP